MSPGTHYLLSRIAAALEDIAKELKKQNNLNAVAKEPTEPDMSKSDSTDINS